MISALLYLQWNSTKNRLVARLKRLKQPKYLAGAIAGGLYFYFYFFRWLFPHRGQYGSSANGFLASPDNLPLYESLGALILLGILVLAWVIPHQRAALTFTEAEIAFLFPAPVTRRMLIHFKLIRSQVNILFTTLFLMLIFSRSAGHFWIRAAGWWIILSTLRLHFLGSSFALTKLMDRGITNWQRRLGVLTVVLAGVLAIGVWARFTLPELKASDVQDSDAFLDYARLLFVSGPTPYLLFPFRLVVRPFVAIDAMSFLKAVWPALLILVAHYWWVIRSDVAFEEASVEASQKLAERAAAMRAGKRRAGVKRKRPPFHLRPTGVPLVALLWKNLISAGSAFTARVWILLGVFILVMSFSFRGTSSSWASIVGMVAGMVCAWTLLIGPQLVRQDLRHDLQNADLLKMYPMQGWQVVLGEMLAPVAILTGVHWLLLLLTAVCLPGLRLPALAGSLGISIVLSAAVLFPLLNVILLLIPNAAALLFPAWFQSGREGAHGIEATGQRIIFALGQLLALTVALLPAVVVFAACFVLGRWFAGVVVAIPVAALASAAVLVIEAGAGVLLLGRSFERFDISVEQSP